MCTKNVRQVSFYILKQLEPMFIIFGPQYLDYAYKRMRNFPPRLSYVATLPEKTLSAEYARYSLWNYGWRWLWSLKRTRMMRQTDYRRIPIFLEISPTDWCVCCATSSSRGQQQDPHFPQYAQLMVCRSWTCASIVRCLLCFNSLRRLRLFQFLPDILYGLVYWTAWGQTTHFHTSLLFVDRVTCENVSFPLPWKNCNVK